MERDTNRSLEVDWLDNSVEPSPAGAPVVLVQYRSRGVPFWLFVPVLVIVPLSAILVYHRLVVAKYRRQAEYARQALESDFSVAPAVSPAIVKDEPAEPLAMNSQPLRAGPVPFAPSPVPVSSMTPAVPAVSSATTPLLSPAPSQPVLAAKSVGTDSGNPIPAPAKTAAAPPRSILKKPLMTLGQPAREPAKNEVAERTVATRELTKEGKTSPEDSQGPAAPKRGDGVGEPPNAGQIENGIGELVELKAEPLPTKEEAIRQIFDEAAKKQAEIDGFEVNKQVEFHAIRHSERLKFREELRDLLQTFGNRAGPEIDKLAKRFGYDTDRAKYARAHHAWKFTRMTTLSKFD